LKDNIYVKNACKLHILFTCFIASWLVRVQHCFQDKSGHNTCLMYYNLSYNVILLDEIYTKIYNIFASSVAEEFINV